MFQWLLVKHRQNIKAISKIVLFVIHSLVWYGIDSGVFHQLCNCCALGKEEQLCCSDFFCLGHISIQASLKLVLWLVETGWHDHIRYHFLIQYALLWCLSEWPLWFNLSKITINLSWPDHEVRRHWQSQLMFPCGCGLLRTFSISCLGFELWSEKELFHSNFKNTNQYTKACFVTM